MPSSDGAQRIVIVGGGFCGAVLALHLTRLATCPLGISIIESAADIGRGVAYAGDEPVHRINIPAARMAVFQDDPAHFDRYVRAVGADSSDPAGQQANGDFYAQRRLFGDYMQVLLREELAGNPLVQLNQILGEAVGFRGGSVVIADAAPIQADAIVLATGNPRPRVPQPLAGIADDPRVITDPWQPAALAGFGTHDEVLVIGTGLTMGDVVAALGRRSHRGSVLALSRHGLTQRRKRPGPYDPRPDFSVLPGDTALELLRSVRRSIRATEGIGWEDVIEALRLQGHAIWRRLPENERRRVVRHLKAFWDVHRYQVAPPVDDAMEAMRASGQLTTMAGTIVAATAENNGVFITVRRRGAAVTERHRFDRVVNATGPAMHALIERNPFLADLAAQGLVAADPLELGLHVGPDSQTIGSVPAPFPIFALGLLARGEFGELAGIRELSAQAAEVALSLIRAFDPAASLPARGDLLVIPGRPATAAAQRLPEPTC